MQDDDIHYGYVLLALIVSLVSIGFYLGGTYNQSKIFDSCKQDKVYHIDMERSMRCEVYDRK